MLCSDRQSVGSDLVVSAIQILGRVAATLTTGDSSIIAPDLAAGAVVWHNYDGVEVAAQDAFMRARHLTEIVSDLRVNVVRVDATHDGAVAQIEILGTVISTGASLCARNCVFLRIAKEKLIRVEEYVDPTFGSQLALDDADGTPR